MAELCSKCRRHRPQYIADPSCMKGGYCLWVIDIDCRDGVHDSKSRLDVNMGGVPGIRCVPCNIFVRWADERNRWVTCEHSEVGPDPIGQLECKRCYCHMQWSKEEGMAVPKHPTSIDTKKLKEDYMALHQKGNTLVEIHKKVKVALTNDDFDTYDEASEIRPLTNGGLTIVIVDADGNRKNICYAPGTWRKVQSEQDRIRLSVDTRR